MAETCRHCGVDVLRFHREGSDHGVWLHYRDGYAYQQCDLNAEPV